MVAVAVVAGACSHGSAKGKARLTVEGDSAVAAPKRAFRAVSGTRTLGPDDRVRVRTGTAVIALAGGGRLELRALPGDPGSSDHDTVVRMGPHLFLQSGELMVEPDGPALRVATDEAGVTVQDGVTRLSRTLALTVTAYRGRASIDSPGGAALSLRAPRQATVAARGVVPDGAVAAAYNPADTWDRRFLGSAIQLGYQLQRDSAGFTAQLPDGEGHSPDFLRHLYPALSGQPGFDSLLRPALGPGENLVGAAIVLAGKAGTFPERWHQVFDFRNPDPAAVDCSSPVASCVNWGLVAMDQGVTDQDGLAAAVDGAIGQAPKRFTAVAKPDASGQPTASNPAAPKPLTPRPSQAPTGPAQAPARPASPTPATPSNPSASPPGPAGPIPAAPAPATVPLLDHVVDPLVDIVNGLLGGLTGSPSGR